VMTVSQASVRKNTLEFLKRLPLSKFLVLRELNYRSYRYGNKVEVCQTILAQQIGYEKKSVYRATDEFVNLGIITKETITKKGWNSATLITFTDFFSIHGVRAALGKYFGCVTQLLSKFKRIHIDSVHTLLKNKSNKNLQISSPSLNVSLTLNPAGPDRNLSFLDCISQEKGDVGEKMNENHIRKVLLVEAALVKRGEKQEEIDTAKLMAFSEACLDYASRQMRHAKPKLPFNYYLKLCFDWSRDNNTEPNFKLADQVRGEDLLKPYRAAVVDSIKQQLADKSTARTAAVKQTYEDQIRERADIQRRVDEKAKVILDAAVERKRATYRVLTPEEKMKVDHSNPFMAIVIKAQIEALRKLEWGSDEAEAIRKNLNDWGVPL
jgi:hypothetical protein